MFQLDASLAKADDVINFVDAGYIPASFDQQ